jgi:hypothetical protein
MTLTENEVRVVAHAFALRHDEHPGQDLWFCAEDWLLPECVCLVESGYLDRSWHGDDLVFRLSDAMFTAQEISSLTSGIADRQN